MNRFGMLASFPSSALVRPAAVFLALLTCAAGAVAQSSQSVRFAPDASIDSARHDGGLAGWAGDFARRDQNIAYAVSTGPLLMRSLVLLDDYRGRDLDGAFLDRLRAGFRDIRDNGAKVIPRFAYASSENAADAPLDRVLRHIAQLGPVLAENVDVIAWFEAGFIGGWGEWYASSNGLDSASSKDRIRDALLTHFPIERQILFRYPADVRRWFPQGRPSLTADDFADSDPQASKPARGQMDTARRLRSDGRRTGVHSDCFLSGNGDGGTYPSDDVRSFTQEWSRTGLFGGEMCAIGPQRRSCRDVQSEGPALHVGYLNSTYQFPSFRSQWQAEGCDQAVIQSIGPQIAIESASHATTAGASLPFTVTIRNLGWTRIFNRRRLEVVLVGDGGRQASLLLDASSVDWAPVQEGGRSSYTASLPLPADLPSGRYAVALRSPDPARSLAGDSRYAMRFANRDGAENGQRWDAGLGAFRFGTSVTISR